MKKIKWYEGNDGSIRKEYNFTLEELKEMISEIINPAEINFIEEVCEERIYVNYKNGDIISYSKSNGIYGFPVGLV